MIYTIDRTTGTLKPKALQFQGDDYLKSNSDTLSDSNNLPTELLGKDYYVPTGNPFETDLAPAYGLYFQNHSVYDKEIQDLTRLDEGYSVNNLRAEHLSGAVQLMNSLAKGAITAGATFLESAGMLWGLGEMAYDLSQGRKPLDSLVWNNTATRFLDSVKEWSEEVMPNYYTKQEEEGGFWDNIGTANFWGDKVLKNMGFTVGALYSANAFSKFNAITHAMKAFKASLRAIQTVGMFTNSAVMAASEGSIEALLTYKDMMKENIQLADARRQEALTKALLNATSAYDYERQKVNIDLAYKQDLQIIDEASKAAGNLTLALNMPILMASNTIEWSRVFAKSYSATKQIEGNIKRQIKDGVTLYVADPRHLGKDIAKGLFRGHTEGTEEMSQAIASNFAKNAYELLIMLQFDPENKERGINWGKAATEAFYNTLSDKNAWEEYGIGAITGIVGVPTFGRSMNSSTETYIGRDKPIGLTGGLFGEIRSSREDYRMRLELANKLNERIQSPQYLEFYNNLGARMTMENFMLNIVNTTNSEKPFKDAEASQLFYDVQLFMQAGLIDDLKDDISKPFDVTEENINSLIDATSRPKYPADPSNKEVIGPYLNVGALKIQQGEETKYSNVKSAEEIQARVDKNKLEFLDAVNKIAQIQNDIATETNNQLGWDLLSHLTYLKFKVDNFNKRQSQLTSEAKKDISNLWGKATSSQYGVDARGAIFQDAMTKTDSLLQSLITDSKVDSKTGTFEKGSYANDLLEGAKTFYDKNSQEYAKFKQKIYDLYKLNQDKQAFDKAYNEYIKNPQKQAEDIAAYKARRTAEKKSKISEEIKKGVTDDTSYSEFADKVAEIYKRNQDVNIDDILSDLSNSKDTSKQLKNLLQTHATNANIAANYVSAILNEENLSDEEKQSAINALLNLLKESESIDELQEKINNLVNDTDMNQDAFDLIKQHLVEAVKLTIEALNKKKGTAPNASAKQASNIKSSTPQQPAVKKPVLKNSINKKTEPTVNPLPVTFELGGPDNAWTTSLFYSDWSAFGIVRTPESQNTTEVPTNLEFEDFEISDAYNNMPEYVDYSLANESNEFRPSKYAYYVYKYLCQKGAFTDNPLKVKPVGNQAPKVTFVNQSIETELGGYERVTLIYYNYKGDKDRGLLVGAMVGNVSSLDNATEFLKAAIEKDSTELPTSTNINRDSIGNGLEKDVIVAESTVSGYKGARVPLKDPKNETEHKENPLKEVITSDDEIAIATSEGLNTSTGRTISLGGLEKGTTYVIIDKASDGTQTNNVFPFPIYVHPFSEILNKSRLIDGLDEELVSIAYNLTNKTSNPKTFKEDVDKLNKEFNKLIFIPRLSQEKTANAWFNIKIKDSKKGKLLWFESNITGLSEQYKSQHSIDLNEGNHMKVYGYINQELLNLDKYILDKTTNSQVLGGTEYDGVRFNVDLSRISDKEYRQKLLDTEGFLTINLEKNQLRVSGGVLKINPLIPSTKTEKPKFEVREEEDYIGYMNEPMPESNVEVLPDDVEKLITGQQPPSNPVFKPVDGGKTFTVLGGNNIISTEGKQKKTESTEDKKPDWISKATNDDDTETEIEISEDMTIPKAQFNKGKIVDLDKELKWLSERLPKLSNQVLVKIVNDAIENKGDTVTVGRLLNHTMLLSKKAPNGVVYHESFHGVLAFMLSPVEKEELYRQLHQLFDYRIPKDVMDRIKGNKISYDLAVEEIAAEDFRLYMIRQDKKQQGNFIQRLFAKIKDFIDSFNDNYNDILNFYNKIRNGQIADNQPVSSSEAVISYTEDSYWEGKTYDSLDSLTQENVSKYLKNHNTNSVKFDNLPNETKRLILQCVMF